MNNNFNQNPGPYEYGEDDISEEEVKEFNEKELARANRAHVLSCVTEMMSGYNEANKIAEFEKALIIADKFMQSDCYSNTTKQ